ncbi:hypothetical protein [Bacillus sp. M6-12]|uniref:hypothetical protein n=1 Tax=Bacillus sp. M6-12 TaxID=2054166 RepID=UPI0015E075B9|nr:hypothetical protein [Bacillus sp. M6-12]
MKHKNVKGDKKVSDTPKRQLHKVIIGDSGVGKASRNTLCKVEDLILQRVPKLKK